MFLIPGAGHVRRESLDVNLAPRHRRVHELVPCIQCGSSAGVWAITAWARTLRERVGAQLTGPGCCAATRVDRSDSGMSQTTDVIRIRHAEVLISSPRLRLDTRPQLATVHYRRGDGMANLRPACKQAHVSVAASAACASAPRAVACSLLGRVAQEPSPMAHALGQVSSNVVMHA